MAETISFIKDTVVEKTSTLSEIMLDNGVIKHGQSTKLPQSEAANTIIYTTDTGEFYMGQGSGKPLIGMDDILFFEKSEMFPAPGRSNVLYIDRTNNSMFIWAGSQYLKTAGGEGGATPVIVKWNDIENKPTEFPVATHRHDESYYTKTQVDMALATVETVDWVDVLNKPSKFPPEAHAHGEYALASDAASKQSVTDLSSSVQAIGDAVSGINWSTLSGKPVEFPAEAHTHAEYALASDVATKTELSDAIAGVTAPNWASIQNKPAEFTPEAHEHNEYALASDAATKVELNNAKIEMSTPDWSNIQNKPVEFTPAAHTHADLHSPSVLGTKMVDETDIGTGKTLIFNGTGLVYADPNAGAIDAYTKTEADQLLLAKQNTSEKDAANGYAGLDATGKIAVGEIPALPATTITQDTTHRFVTDAEKTTWSAKQAALGFTPENAANKAVANGYASLDSSAKVPLTQIPTLAASSITQDASNRFLTDAERTAWNAKQAALGFTPENAANKGAANGYAGLDATGKVPSAQLPSFVDDILEYANLAGMPATGETGKIYVALDTNKIYRWSGSAYVEVSASAGNADTATKLATARTISLTGDATGSASFDGSANAAIAAILANSGVAAGTFKSVTVNVKGLVTAGTNPTTLAGYGITDATPSSHIGSTGATHGLATAAVNGFMSAADKAKLDTLSTPNLSDYMLKSDYDTDDDNIVEMADAALSAPWSGITGKPMYYNPAAHTHVPADITGLSAGGAPTKYTYTVDGVPQQIWAYGAASANDIIITKSGSGGGSPKISITPVVGVTLVKARIVFPATDFASTALRMQVDFNTTLSDTDWEGGDSVLCQFYRINGTSKTIMAGAINMGSSSNTNAHTIEQPNGLTVGAEYMATLLYL